MLRDAAMEILILLVLFVLNGLFSMSETAVVSSRKARLQQWADLFAQFLRQVVIREGEAILYTARHVEHDGFLPRGDVEVHDVKVCESLGRSTPMAPEAEAPQRYRPATST